MANILDEIVSHKQSELKRNLPNKQLFMRTFEEKERTKVMAEVKLASPKFDLSDKITPQEIIDFYGNHDDIVAMSILIDYKYFKGDIKRAEIAKPYGKPLFFKEFVIDRRQLDGAAYFGFDGALILNRILTKEQMIDLTYYANEKNIYPIIEVDTPEDLGMIFNLNLDCDYAIGYNCRNLGTMEIDRQKHFGLYEEFKDDFERHIMFAFSGIENLEQVEEYNGMYNGVLIGTSFVHRMTKFYS